MNGVADDANCELFNYTVIYQPELLEKANDRLIAAIENSKIDENVFVDVHF